MLAAIARRLLGAARRIVGVVADARGDPLGQFEPVVLIGGVVALADQTIVDRLGYPAVLVAAIDVVPRVRLDPLVGVGDDARVDLLGRLLVGLGLFGFEVALARFEVAGAVAGLVAQVLGSDEVVGVPGLERRRHDRLGLLHLVLRLVQPALGVGDQGGVLGAVKLGGQLGELLHLLAQGLQFLILALSRTASNLAALPALVGILAGRGIGIAVLLVRGAEALVLTILGLVVVLADGRAVRLGGPHLKDSAGLSLTKLFVGSEGTLGIITEIIVRLIPAQLVQSTVVATFGSLADACQAVLDITMKMRPSMLEFMDKATINAVEDDMRMDLDRTAEALLVARSDAPGDYSAVEAEAMAEIFRNRNATEVFVTDDPDEGEAFTAARRSAFHAMGKKGYVLFEDVGVAIPKLGDLVVGVEKIGLAHNVQVATVAHAGDGNTHPMIVFDETDPAAVERAHLAFGAIMDLAIELGGTITGEHGVGRLKKAWLPNQLGEDVMDLTRRIKNALDPQGILNPGSVI